MHGGDLYRNQITYDFSVNVNPCGAPDCAKKAIQEALQDISCYPDPFCEHLVNALAKRHEVMPDEVVCGNGVSELLMGIVNTIQPKTALVLAPCFSGYEYVCKAINTELFYYHLQESNDFTLTMEEINTSLRELIVKKRPTLFFLSNPNNPTGHCLTPGKVRVISEICAENGTKLILDESFLELTEYEEKTSYKNTAKHVMVLRSFTKSHALAGVRLGYLLCKDQEFHTSLKSHLPEWNVSIFSQKAGEAVAVHADDAYLSRAKKIIKDERAFLADELTKVHFRVFPSDANYLLFFVPDQVRQKSKASLYDFLLDRGFLIRDCSDFKGLKEGYYRIAVLDRKKNLLLIEQIKKYAGDSEL